MVRPKIPDMDPDKRARLDKIYEQRKQCEKQKVTYVYLVTFIEDFQQYLILAMTTEGVFLVKMLIGLLYCQN
jgi:hypothetical protein